DKPRWLVLNKADLLPVDQREKLLRAFVRKLGWKGKTFIISALTGEGCQRLVYAVMDHLDQAQKDKLAADAPTAASTTSDGKTRDSGSREKSRA
ncbi:MAG: GTPase ObgE, partial [Burkholderiales bacterium]